MKAPKNYYNVVDQKKLGLDQIDKNAAAIAELQDLPVLPTPAAGDTGKVVKVGEDGYELASDAGAKLVTATVTADGQGNLSCDKTYAELSASIANGDVVELSYNNQTFVFSGIDYPGIHFVLAKNDSNGHNVITAWTISSANVITFNIEGMNSELPTVTSADAGKVLGVDDSGNWTLTKDTIIIDAVLDENSAKVTFTDTVGNIYNMIKSHLNAIVYAHDAVMDIGYYFTVSNKSYNSHQFISISNQGSSVKVYSFTMINTSADYVTLSTKKINFDT